VSEVLKIQAVYPKLSKNILCLSKLQLAKVDASFRDSV